MVNKKSTKEKNKIKKAVKKRVVKKPGAVKKPPRYFEGIGRRKTAVARVRLSAQGQSDFLINGKPLEKYLPFSELQQIAQSTLDKMNCLNKFSISVKVKGGGLHAQAEAVRHGISRALIKFDSDYRKRLKKIGFLTRDSRMRERKKFGLKRARRAPQWSKR